MKRLAFSTAIPTSLKERPIGTVYEAVRCLHHWPRDQRRDAHGLSKRGYREACDACDRAMRLHSTASVAAAQTAFLAAAREAGVLLA